MTLKFGTDGIRGVANAELTPELALAVGRAAARLLKANEVVIGRDTRWSGPMLEAAIAAGFACEGTRVRLAGVVPTPAVAYACAEDGAVGAMISASHNPWEDNGIKLFAPGGRKLPDSVEAGLEAEIGRLLAEQTTPEGPGGEVVTDAGVLTRWEAHVAGSLDGRRLDGLRLVVDLANGSATAGSASVLEGLGADVTVISSDPDGRNINAACGSTHPRALQDLVVTQGADVGIAFDGDADRMLAVDATGNLIDGDEIIAMCALDMAGRGVLHDNTVVVTVMTNLGFRLAMREAGITVIDTAVGDRYVLEALDAGDYSIGGEQSGHVIFPSFATTGDGLLTALQLLDLVRRSGRSLGDLAAEAMQRLPQVLQNVKVSERGADVSSAIAADIEAAEQRLGERGRVLIRPSGTEPVVRVMVEAETADLAEAVATELSEAVRAATAPK